MTIKRFDSVSLIRASDRETRENETAEGVGFEPTESLHPQRFSRPPHSTALPPLRRNSDGTLFILTGPHSA
jgi:hypothetical protein